jgi:uncharacterized cupin superfamily protein
MSFKGHPADRAFMQHVSVEDPEDAARTADVMSPLTEALGLSDMALNYYELGPGDSMSGGLHTHMDQEELFYVLEGTATFETPEETLELGPGEAIRFAPGEYQEGRNESDGRVRALAMGAPQDQGETRSAVPCQECGADYHVVEIGEESVTLVCPDCGNEFEV